MLAILLAIVGFTALCECQVADGVTIQVGERVIPNHGLLTVQDLFIDANGTAINQTVSCRTTFEPCCSDTVPILTSGRNDSTYFGAVPTGVGSWLYPRDFHIYTIRLLERDILFGITRDNATNSVNLFRSRNESSNTHDGIWRCRIPDANGDEQDVYVGIYDADTPNYGVLSSGGSNCIRYSEVSADPVMFTLTFDTTRGPATTVTWTRDGVNISTNSTFVTYQIVVARSDSPDAGYGPSPSRYSNRLTVSGRNAGVYGVSVSNVRTSPPITTSVTILDLDLHPTVTAEHTEDLTGIRVTWTLQLGQPESNFLRDYTVQYTCSPSCGGQTFNTTNTEFTLSNAFLSKTYTFTVMSNFNSVSPPMYALPLPPAMGVSISITTPATGVIAPVITTPVELLNATSARVTWTQPTGGVTVNDYVVTYRRTNGREGQCSSLPSSALTMETQGVTTLDIPNLEEFSVYEVTVTGRAGAFSNTSHPVTFETSSTVPSAAPENLAIDATTPTNVSLSWDSVECIHRNGLITEYIISYAPVSDTSFERGYGVPSSGQENGGSYTVTGLWPGTNYNFKVAAKTDAGVRVFTAISVKGQTIGVQRPNISTPLALLSATSVRVTWTQPEGGLTVNDYVVTYRRINGREGQCSSFVDNGRNVTVSGDKTSATLPGLEAFSNYQVTVTGRNSRFRISLFNTSEPMEFETSSTAPSSSPENLRVTEFTNTSTTLSWDSVECIHRNGLITHYIISYEPVGDVSQTRNISVNVFLQDDSGSYVVTGLEPSTIYLIRIAAANCMGVGEFSMAVESGEIVTERPTVMTTCAGPTTTTTAPSAAPHNPTVITYTPTTVSLSWDSVECIHRNGLITHYIVNSEPVTEISLTSITVTIRAKQQESGGSYTVAGLQPTTDYSFKVAAVNEVGQGEFSAPLQWQTSNTEPAAEGSKCLFTNTGTIAGVSTLLVLILLLVATFGAVILGIWCHRSKASKVTKGERELEAPDGGSLAEPQSKGLEAIYDEPNLPTNPPPSSSSVEMETCLAYKVLKK